MKDPDTFSRRDFLRLGASASLSWLLYACGASPTPEPTLAPPRPPGSRPTRPPATRPLPTATSQPTTQPLTTAAIARPRGGLSEAVLYYLGYATEDNMQWVQEFDVDVLTRGFLLFLNSTDAWIPAYQPRIQQCQDQNRLFLVAIQAAVLVENASDLPRLSGDDPALSFPMDSIPQWQDYACRTPEGLTLKEARNMPFAHACINNAQFRQFFQDRLRLLVDCGADGVHVDELPTRYFAFHEGYCDACMAGLSDYLARKYTAADLQSRYGIADVQTFDFRDRLAQEGNLQTAPQSPLHREWWLYQLTNLSQVEAEVFSSAKAHASSQGRQFLVNANAFEPERNPERAIEMALGDFVAMGTGMTIDLRKDGQQASALRIPPQYSYIPLYRMAQGVAPGKPVTLFIDGPGGTGVIKGLPEQKQRDVVRWMFAEAYSAGAHFHVPYPSLDYYAPLEECQRYARFILDNWQMYKGAVHLADVGVLFSYASEVWDYWVKPASMEPNHNRQWYGLCQALTDSSIQYDVLFAADGNIIEDTLTLEELLRCRTLMVPWAYSLRDDHVALLQDYARSGRGLVIFGDLATVDEEKNGRPTPVIDSLRSLGATLLPTLDLETYLNDPQGRDAATVLSELASLIPNPLVTVANGSVTAQLTRRGSTVYCHLINKDLQDSGFTPQSGLQVRVTIPADLQLADNEAVYTSPEQSGGQPALLPTTAQGSVVEVTVPTLEIYGIIGLRCKPRS